jgi:hypothetical protein
MEHIREGKHGARSTKQAIAIALSKARRSGVPLPPPAKGRTSESMRRRAKRDVEKGRGGPKKVSARRSRATTTALRREPKKAASRESLAKQAREAARRRRKAA